MSQEATLRALDARLLEALSAAGLADAAVYRALADPYTEVDCTILVDHGIEFAGEAPTAVVGARTTVRLASSEIPSPAKGDTLTIGSTVYTLLEPVVREPGISQVWTVRYGRS